MRAVPVGLRFRVHAGRSNRSRLTNRPTPSFCRRFPSWARRLRPSSWWCRRLRSPSRLLRPRTRCNTTAHVGTAHPDSEPKIGDTFGPFRLEGLLGEGGMARVYRARREVDGETVALKLMKPELIGDDIFAKRFVHEARSAAEVRHANLVPIFDAGEVDGRYYLAVGYVNGRTVDDRIRTEGPLPLGDVVRFASDVASALDALHAAGIVHRDIKASNLLLDETGRTLLSDFGLAKGRAYTVLTRPGQVVGTPGPHRTDYGLTRATTSESSGSARRRRSSSSVSTWCACSRLTTPGICATTRCSSASARSTIRAMPAR